MDTNLLKNTSSSSDFSEAILASLEALGQQAEKIGVALRLYTDDALAQYRMLPEAKQKGLLEHLSVFRDILRMASEDIIPDNEPWGIKQEFHCLNRALWKYNLFAKDDLKDYIKSGDVIEIYNRDAVQIYRNFEFIRLCSYTVLEIMTQEWYVLYDRPQFVTEMLFKAAGEVLRSGQVVKLQIPEHVMRERYLHGRKVFLNNFKYFVPLFERSGEAPAAFLATMRVRPIVEGEEGSNIAMLGSKSNG